MNPLALAALLPEYNAHPAPHTHILLSEEHSSFLCITLSLESSLCQHNHRDVSFRLLHNSVLHSNLQLSVFFTKLGVLDSCVSGSVSNSAWCMESAHATVKDSGYKNGNLLFFTFFLCRVFYKEHYLMECSQ